MTRYLLAQHKRATSKPAFNAAALNDKAIHGRRLLSSEMLVVRLSYLAVAHATTIIERTQMNPGNQDQDHFSNNIMPAI